VTLYLPLILRRWPPIPDTPVLHPIDNPGDDGDYTVSWDHCDRADEYVLEEDGNRAFTSPDVVHSGPALSWEADDRAPGTYYYRVRAINSWGSSDWSDPVSVIVRELDAPVLGPISNPESGGEYTVSWTQVERADAYTLEEDSSAAFASPDVVYSGDKTSWQASDKAPGTYQYRVRASSSWDASDWSDPVSVIVKGAPDVPVLDPIDNDEGEREYSIRWSDSYRAATYILQETTDASFSSRWVVYEGPGTTHAVSGQGPTRYHYRVKARNSWGGSGWSNVEQVDVLWEAEPNDNGLTEANGPIMSGLTYHGTFPSGGGRRDYFYFDLAVAHTAELWLRNIPVGCNYDLALRDDDEKLTALAWSRESGNKNEHIKPIYLSPGRYYVQVWDEAQTGSTEAYGLVVVYED